MRSVRIATWTSGDPVSPLPWALSLMISCFFSAVTDILSLRGIGEVEAPYDLGRTARNLHQRHRNLAGFGEIEPVGLGHSGKDPALADRLRAFRVEGQGRDTVQPRLQRQEVVFKRRALADFLQDVQRNRLLFKERAGLQAP